MPRSRDWESRLPAVRLLAMDVDGVLTDGQILLTGNGDEIKAFHAHDGVALQCWRRAGHRSAWITARGSPAVQRRARELGVTEVVLESRQKGASLREVAARLGVPLEHVAFLGDDLQDLSALTIAGVAISVPACPPEVAARVDFVTERAGGCGAVREVVERILKAQDRWDSVLAEYLA